MQRLVTLLLTCLFVFNINATVWAQSAAPATTPKGSSSEVIYLIDKDLKGNFSAIQTKASDLSSDQRYFIYTEKKKEPLIGFLLNFLIGLGIGSFVIGDSVGGMNQLIGELIGIGVSGLSAGIGSAMGTSNPLAFVFALAALGGLVTLLVYRIGGWIRPFDYTKEYNNELQNALNIGSTAQGLAPYYQTRSDTTGQTYHEGGMTYAFSF